MATLIKTADGWQDIQAGPQGPPGPQGPQGIKGPQGNQGPSSYMAKCIPDLWAPIFPWATMSYGSSGTTSMILTRAVLPMAVKAVQLDIASADALSNFRVCFYSEGPMGPGDLLYQSDSIPGSPTGAKVAQLPIIVPAGAYWIGGKNISGGTAGPRDARGLNPFLPGKEPFGATATVQSGWSFGSLGLEAPASLKKIIPTYRTGYPLAIFVQAA